MKLKGKNNSALEGMHAHERHGFDRFGDGFNADVAQFLGFTKFVIDLEGDAEKEVQGRAPGWWKRQVLPRLQSELRRAIIANDGQFFRALADHIDARGKRPVDPLREWINRALFQVVSDAKGTRTVQPHEGKTFNELLDMFRAEHKDNRPDGDVARRQFTALGVRWKKSKGGRRPRKLRL